MDASRCVSGWPFRPIAIASSAPIRGCRPISPDFHVHVLLQRRVKVVAHIRRQADLRAVGQERTIDDVLQMVVEQHLDGSCSVHLGDRPSFFPWRHWKIQSIGHSE